ncbi:hypothetical protein COY05_00240 [Candidatus Peregrinibacteria bacterium CG_4_10_14_0_2_um_filter_38_24]|nr:MAG: hypothetical protein COY05_00240 [Candidatus Peregrinibacteria bacterium CG_4_10_14_0_2_um_filter_38_24]PJC38998.1 MAG: hypothetical protein CO044_02065 [Candidatus Peregrinibacteria bacterium CG_4_9_14_0_2_um_filter_38_9]
MIKQIIKILLIGFILSIVMTAQLAQGVSLSDPQFSVTIAANDIVEAGKNIIFDISSPQLLYPDEPVTYSWDFGDKSPFEKGEEVVHSFKDTGSYQVTLTMKQRDKDTIVIHNVFVYSKLMALLTDISDQKETIQSLVEEAKDNGIFIKVIDSYDSTTAFISEEALAKKTVEEKNILGSAENIILWTSRGSGINSLTRLVQERPEIKEILKGKSLIVISEKNLTTLGRIMQSNFNIIEPQQIILTRQHQLRNLIASASTKDFIISLSKGGAQYSIINAESSHIGLWNAISSLVNYMITKGIPSNTIVLLLMLPLIVTLITFIKQVIGFGTFGLYSTSIITLSFLALGINAGLAILAVIIITGALFRKVLDRFHLLHHPRLAIILCSSTLVILGLLAFGAWLNVSQIASIAVFPILVMTTMAEKFANALSGRGYKATIFLMTETMAVSILCYELVEWEYMQTLMLAYPELILLLLLINVLLSRWTGLRLTEIFRFREVMKHAEEE